MPRHGWYLVEPKVSSGGFVAISVVEWVGLDEAITDTR